MLIRQDNNGQARKGMTVKLGHTKYRLMGWNEVKRTITVEGPSGKCYVEKEAEQFGLKFS